MRSIEDRNRIVEKHLDLAESLTKRRYKTVHCSVLYGDILSAAYEGLLDAANRFDDSMVNPQAKKPFEAYATMRILGSINDYLRSCNWGTRNNPQYLLSINQDSRGAEFSGYGDGATIGDNCANNDRSVVDRLNGRELFEKILRGLPQRERQVFRLRYLYGLTMREVADAVEISESRVSQILSESTKYLKSIWDKHSEDLWNEIATTV